MATITTSTTAAATPVPGGSAIDRSVATGDLWAAVRTTATQISLYKSTDSGASWLSQGSFTRTGMYELGEMRIDNAGEQMHLVWCENTSSTDKVIYRRVDIRSGSADLSSGVLTVASTGATSAGDFYQTASVVPIKNPDGSYMVLCPVAFHNPTAVNGGIYIYGVSVASPTRGYTTTKNDLLVQSTRQYFVSSGTVEASVAISADWEHNGDGATAATPHVWLSYQLYNTAYCLKLTWRGYRIGWTSPTTAPTVATSRISTSRDLIGRWDGDRFVIIAPRPTDTSKLDVFERNSNNTGNAATRITPTHPQGVIGAHTLSYNHVTGDARVFSTGTTNLNVYYVDYIRASNTWGAWTLVSATAPISSRWGVRRSTAGTNQYDEYRTQGAGSPWSVVNNAIAVNFAPQTPTWITGTAGTVSVNGAAADVSASLTFDWEYTDPNPTDAQSQYALTRQIGAAAVQWWRTSDNTWQASETFNTSASTQVTLTSGQWVGGGGAADAAHTYKVTVKDTGGLASSQSAGLGVVPSTRVDPTLTAPVGGSTLNTGVVTATWTVAEQSAYRVTVTNTATSVVVHDSGFLSDTGALAYQVPVALPDGFQGSLTLQTKNAEGLSSVLRTAAFTIDFVEPVAPLITALAAVPAAGGINVTVTQPAAVGTQPATVRLDLWHRKAAGVSATNTNPFFETNATDWTNSGYSSAARSTVFAHTGVGALLLTPSGAAATPYVQTTTIYPAAAGTRWQARGWFRSTTANKTVRIRLQWYNVSNVLISESTRDLTPVAGAWVWMDYEATAPDLTTGVRLAVGQINTPAGGDTVYVDEMVLMPASDDAGIRIATDITSGAAVLDWRTVTGVNYEWRAYAEAGNGTDVYGPWVSA